MRATFNGRYFAQTAVLIVAVFAGVHGLSLAQDVPGAEAGQAPGLCIDPFGTFDPLVIGGGCYFGFEPTVDASLVLGRTALNDDYAPPGTVVEAWVNGQECGTATVPTGSVFRMFKLRVLGAGERDGCAVAGDTVEFQVDGVPALQTLSWQSSSGFPIFLSLTATPQHAWYWFESTAAHLPPAGTPVQVLVDGTVCGDTVIEREVDGPFFGIPENIAGFSRLIVPSEEIEPGCGRLGAIISFLVDGLESETALVWEPGLQRIDLALSGDVDCDLDPNAIDAALVLQFEADLVQELACQDMADVNNDGGVDSIDAALILQFEAGLVESLPVSSA